MKSDSKEKQGKRRTRMVERESVKEKRENKLQRGIGKRKEEIKTSGCEKQNPK